MDGDNRTRGPKVKLEELLLRHGSITEEQLQAARIEQKKWGGELGRVMVDLGFIGEELLMQSLSRYLGIPKIDPFEEDIPRTVVSLLGVQVCERFGVIAVEGDAEKRWVRVATSDPANPEEMRALSATTRFKVQVAAATSDSISRAIRKYYYGEGQAPREPPAYGPEVVTSVAPPPLTTPLESPALPDPPPTPALPPRVAPLVPPVSSVPTELFGQLVQRVARLEQELKSSRDRPADLTHNAEFAGLSARLERLEQLAVNEASAIRALGEVMLEKGLVTRDELAARMRGVKKT